MTIPYWHPLVVHFPIALLVVAGLGALAWGLTGHRFARRFTLVLLALGTVGAGVARYTGETLMHDMEGDPAVERYGEAHEDAANYTLVVSITALVLMSVAEARARRSPDAPLPVALRAGAALLVVTAAGLVVRTGHLGGLMVWGVSEARPEGSAADE